MMKRLLVLGVGIAGLTACGDDGSASTSACEADTRDEAFGVGLSKSDGGLKVTFESATPAPPARGTNTLEVQVTNGGSPFDGRLAMKAWMPDHGHGSNPLWNEAEWVESGKYRVGPTDLFMSGLWELTFRATTSSPAASLGEVSFRFCLER